MLSSEMCRDRAPIEEKVVLGTVAKPSRRAEGWILGSAVRKSVMVTQMIASSSVPLAVEL
jgi:hypothetical protein